MLVDKIENMDSMGRLLVELQLVKGVLQTVWWNVY